MKYYYGVGAASSVFVVMLMCPSWVAVRRQAENLQSEPVVEARIFLDPTSDNLLIHGEQRTVSLAFRNKMDVPIQLKSLRFSMPWASLSRLSTVTFPCMMLPNGENRFTVQIAPPGPEVGLLRVGCTLAVDHKGREHFLTQYLEVECAARVNADPSTLSLGNMAELDGPQMSEIFLWHPARVETPSVRFVTSDDPAVTAVFVPGQTTVSGGRHYFGKVLVSVDPRRLPRLLQSTLVVHSVQSDVTVKCFAWGKP